MREQIHVSGVVIMHVGDDHLGDIRCTQPQRFQCAYWAAEQTTTTRVCSSLIETGINKENLLFATNQPDEIVHWHGQIMGVVGIDEVFSTHTIHIGISNREYLVLG
ncbi:hypothetical protein BLX42_10740 [Pseudomonas sp. SG-MS2]|nr:hypothetical protein BLX42_10740 [Pseudomonas sp. SG-MS2]